MPIFSGTRWRPTSVIQWAPSFRSHDPNPPITLEFSPLVLNVAPLKLVDSQAAIPARNTNVTGLTKDKIGPQGIARDPRSRRWRMWAEGVSGVQVGPGPFDYQQAPFHSTASQLQGPYTIEGGTPTAVITANLDPDYENGEISFGTVYWDASSNRWAATGHVGNNSQARRIYLFWSTDNVGGLTWERDAGNPLISEGSGGEFDDSGCADLKWVVKPNTSTVVGLYAGRAALGNQPTVGRATASLSDLTTWTKTGEVISLTGAPSWRAGGASPGSLHYDSYGRLHLWFVGYTAGNVGSIGYAYSDDDGQTWSENGVSNPLLSAGADASYDELAGDVVQGVEDGDVMFFTYGGSSDNYAGTGGSPFDNPAGAIVPLAREVRTRTGKFYPPPATPRNVTTVTGTSILSNTVFTLCGRFRAWRLERSAQFRGIWSELAAFNEESYVRISTNGQLDAWVRTPTNFLSMASGVTVDTGEWVQWALIREATNSFTFIVNGATVDTDTTTLGTTASVTTKTIGNMADSGIDEPLRGTVSDVVSIIGTALTWPQVQAVLRDRTFPAGVSPTIDFPTDGVDSGRVVLVEAQGDDLVTPPFLPLLGVNGHY